MEASSVVFFIDEYNKNVPSLGGIANVHSYALNLHLQYCFAFVPAAGKISARVEIGDAVGATR